MSYTNILRFKLVFLQFFVLSQSFCQKNWQCIGPYQHIENNRQWSGFINQIYTPNDSANLPYPPSVLFGTEYSGLFVIKNDSCISLSDSLNLPGLGINEIVNHPTNPSKILVATGISKDIYVNHSNKYGLLYSEDSKKFTAFKKMYRSFDQTHALKILELNQQKITDTNFSNFFVVSEKKGNSQLWEFDQKKWRNHSFSVPYLSESGMVINDFKVLNHNTFLIALSNKFANKPKLLIGKQSRFFKSIKWQSIELKTSKPTNSFTISSVFDRTLYVRTALELFESTDLAENFSPITLKKVRKKDAVKKGIYYSKHTGLVYLAGIQPSVYNPRNKQLKNFNQGHDDVRDMQSIGVFAGKEHIYFANDGGVSLVKIDTSTLESSYDILSTNSQGLHELWSLSVAQSEKEQIITGAMHNNSFVLKDGKWSKIGCGDGGLSAQVNDQFIHSCNNRLMLDHKVLYSNNYWYLNSGFELKNDSIFHFTSSQQGSRLSSFIQLNINTKTHKSSPIQFKEFKYASSIASNNLEGHIIYLANQGIAHNKNQKAKLLKSIDQGKSFIDLSEAKVYHKNTYIGTLNNCSAWSGISSVEVDQYNANILYIGLNGQSENEYGFIENRKRILKSIDAGQNFYDISDGLSGHEIYCLKQIYHEDHPILFAGTAQGIYLLLEGQKNWIDVSKCLPKVPVTDIDLNKVTGTLYLSTFGRSIYKKSLSSILP